MYKILAVILLFAALGAACSSVAPAREVLVPPGGAVRIREAGASPLLAHQDGLYISVGAFPANQLYPQGHLDAALYSGTEEVKGPNSVSCDSLPCEGDLVWKERDVTFHIRVEKDGKAYVTIPQGWETFEP